MSDTSTANRTWTEIAKDYTEGDKRAAVERAIEALRWVSPEGSFPMSPGLAIKECIRELGIPRVSQVAHQDGFIGNYSVYGIEGNFTNGRARIYVLDRGADLLVLASDHWPKEDTQ